MYMHTIASYFRWHYADGMSAVLQRALLRVRGFVHYFSIIELARTLFWPWHSIPAASGLVSNPLRFVASSVLSMFSRIAGALLRAITLVAGLASALAAAFFGIGAVVVWLVVPMAIPVLLALGLILIMA